MFPEEPFHKAHAQDSTHHRLHSPRTQHTCQASGFGTAARLPIGAPASSRPAIRLDLPYAAHGSRVRPLERGTALRPHAHHVDDRLALVDDSRRTGAVEGTHLAPEDV